MPSIAFSQVATFYTDSSKLWSHTGHNPEQYAFVNQMQWVIKGKVLRLGSEPVEIEIDQKIDTLFFRQHDKARWDTIICMISKPLSYKFIHNECCGGFYIADEAGHFLKGAVTFKLEDQSKRSMFLGSIGETGMVIKPGKQNTLVPKCRSPLFPNIYNVALREIKRCRNKSGCESLFCVFDPKKKKLKSDFIYRTISEKCNFMYMPLSNEPFLLILNIDFGVVVLKESYIRNS